MFLIYRILYFIISNLLIGLSRLLPPQMQKWIELRSKKTPVISNESQKILFHAASGEIEYVKSIIRQIKTENPDIAIFVSYTSPSAEKLFDNISDQVTAFIPLPWDLPHQMALFFKNLAPELIVISRTDFWPEFIHQAVLQKIPVLAVSLFPTMGYFQNIWLKFNLSKMSLITVVTKKLCDQLDQLLDHKIQIVHIPDTRFDQVIHRLKNPTKFEIQSEKKICVFGSTWPEDEDILFQITPLIINQGYQIIWCPHDVSTQRIQKLKLKLKDFSISIFSENKSPLHLTDQILILDQIGYLADMYRFSQWAFVGGSFKTKVHSVMEPLCAGNPVIVGPYYKNNPEAIDGVSEGIVFTVNNAIEFRQTFNKIDSHNNRINLTDYLNSKSGSSQTSTNLIFNYLNQRIQK